ncbi:DUF6907 domain-containing protein [Streptomyces sp. NPDC018031]|uniref:DUF6907 domain-containing protein n=1 Tax=Streptomyces sp. NPDC018031 TaxID=3365033 RepID=UPI00378CAACC
MTRPRTVTVHTRDHGPVTLFEPPWCLGQHRDGEYRADLVHEGQETALRAPVPAGGHVTVMTAALVAYPHATARGTEPTVAVELSGDWYHYAPAGLDQLAAAAVVHATELRALARQLTVFRASF